MVELRLLKVNYCKTYCSADQMLGYKSFALIKPHDLFDSQVQSKIHWCIKARPKDSDKNLLFFGTQTQKAHKKGDNSVITLVFSNIFSQVNEQCWNVRSYKRISWAFGTSHLHIFDASFSRLRMTSESAELFGSITKTFYEYNWECSTFIFSPFAFVGYNMRHRQHFIYNVIRH